MYNIKINNMKFHSYIGVYAEEKKLGQNIEIDLLVKMKKKDISDNLSNTISYSSFYNEISSIIKCNNVDLIETLAQEIIKNIKKANPNLIDAVKVNVRKLGVPINGIFDSVEIEMEE